MGVVMNSLDREQHLVAGGDHFHFKAGQIKYFYNPAVSNLIVRLKGEQGLVGLPEGFQEKEMQESPEGKAVIAEALKEGRNNYCKKLREQIFNLQVSLKRDLDHMNYKIDPRLMASDGDIFAMEELVKYQQKDADMKQNQVDHIKELEKKLLSSSKV